ncbi:MAG TPA: hypothetical protein VFD00_03325, partial [Thermoclostridium sp.]|nr:hypothetical protein [Thermoclostridium sp.]
CRESKGRCIKDKIQRLHFIICEISLKNRFRPSKVFAHDLPGKSGFVYLSTSLANCNKTEKMFIEQFLSSALTHLPLVRTHQKNET